MFNTYDKMKIVYASLHAYLNYYISLKKNVLEVLKLLFFFTSKLNPVFIKMN